MKRVGIVYGGRSVEHEISILTALEAIDAMDTSLYVPIPVYIDLAGRWWVGDALRNRSFYRRFHEMSQGTGAGVSAVAVAPQPDWGGLVRLSAVKRSTSAFANPFRKASPAIPIDVWMPLLHGTMGEDGTMQGLFELTELPYTGCTVRAAAIGMSKPTTKALAQRVNVPVLPWEVIRRDEFSARNPAPAVERARRLGDWPIFAKPANLGSSVGVSRANDSAGLIAALVNIFQVDTEAMLEPCVADLFEVNVSVRRVDGRPVSSVVEMPTKTSGVLTFDDKYVRFGSKKIVESSGLSSMARAIDPPDLPAGLKESARAHASAVYDVLGCHGVARIDFIVDNRTDELWFNEINTLPGSLAHYLWVASTPSLTYTELLTAMIEEAEARHASVQLLGRDFGFRVLR